MTKQPSDPKPVSPEARRIAAIYADFIGRVVVDSSAGTLTETAFAREVQAALDAARAEGASLLHPEWIRIAEAAVERVRAEERQRAARICRDTIGPQRVDYERRTDTPTLAEVLARAIEADDE